MRSPGRDLLQGHVGQAAQRIERGAGTRLREAGERGQAAKSRVELEEPCYLLDS